MEMVMGSLHCIQSYTRYCEVHEGNPLGRSLVCFCGSGGFPRDLYCTVVLGCLVPAARMCEAKVGV